MALPTPQFNTFNCVAVPRNPDSKLPMPSYERLSSSPAGKSESSGMEDATSEGMGEMRIQVDFTHHLLSKCQ